jgi:hypothetical protein
VLMHAAAAALPFATCVLALVLLLLRFFLFLCSCLVLLLLWCLVPWRPPARGVLRSTCVEQQGFRIDMPVIKRQLKGAAGLSFNLQHGGGWAASRAPAHCPLPPHCPAAAASPALPAPLLL